MKKKILIFFLFFLFSFLLVFIFLKFPKAPYFVAKKGNEKIKFYCKDLCDKEIQKAIEFSKDGGEIIFSEGEFLFSNSVSKDCAIKLSSKISLSGKGEKTILKLKQINSDFDLICALGEKNEEIFLKDFKIVGNFQDSFIQRGIFLRNLSKSKIERVKIEGFSKEGIFCFNCKENEFLENLIKDNKSTGIYLSHSFKNEILKNKVINNDFGILLSFSDENKISENEISLNFADGIYLENSSKNLILKNKISENGGEGPFDGNKID